MPEYRSKLEELLRFTAKEGASDIHFSVGHSPILRINRRLIPLKKFKEINKQDVRNLAWELMNEEQRERFISEGEAEFSYELEKGIRFRTSVYSQRGCVSIAMRFVPARIRTIEELNLPSILHDFCKASQGFVLVTGPSSHGKSTTLAALIDEINHERSEHIITIEDPIEYFFEDDQSIIDQREINKDTRSFANALRASFRQDPDVIMVGEMRDRETIGTAITAAETGHLVFSTLHTNDAAQSIHRIIDTFPPAQQDQIRAQLSASLLGVVAQRLVRRVKGGLVPACEILFSTPAVANLIRENKIHELPMVIETSAEMGMISLNKALAHLIRAEEVSLRTAIQYSLNPAELRKLVSGL